MMRLRRASALVTLYVLASAAMAYAECAWVLWREDKTIASDMFKVEWAVPVAYSDRAACLAQINAKCRPGKTLSARTYRSGYADSPSLRVS